MTDETEPDQSDDGWFTAEELAEMLARDPYAVSIDKHGVRQHRQGCDCGRCESGRRRWEGRAAPSEGD